MDILPSLPVDASAIRALMGISKCALYTKDFPHIGDCINDLFDKYENKPIEDAVLDRNDVKAEPKEAFSIPERFEDFNIHDYV